MLRFGKSEKDFLDIYTSYSGNIHRTLKGMTGNDSVAEELTQDTFIKAWKGLPQFGYKSSLKTWIYQVALNVGRDWLRGHKVRSIEIGNDSLENSSTKQEQADIQETLLAMEDGMREILILFYFEGLKQEEIAAILKVPAGTVKSRLHNARTKLKELLIQKGYDV